MSTHAAVVSTHAAGGLSHSDFVLAAKIDAVEVGCVWRLYWSWGSPHGSSPSRSGQGAVRSQPSGHDARCMFASIWRCICQRGSKRPLCVEVTVLPRRSA